MYGRGDVIILVDKTINELGIDPRKLHNQSNERVYVRCAECGESYLKEYRHRHHKHNCPPHIIRDGIALKWCSKCRDYIPFNSFRSNPNEYDGMMSFCNECANGEDGGFSNWIDNILISYKEYADRHSLEFDLDRASLGELWIEQSGKCARTRVPLTYDSTAPNAADLDRKNPKWGFTRHNTIWVSKGVNSDTSPRDYIDYLSSINYKDLSSVRIEYKLIHEDAKLPFRKRVTDAGYDIYSIEDTIVPPHGMADVHTGLIMSCPPGYYFTVDGRSGMARHGVMPFRGIIDAGYTGELMVGLMNVSDNPYHVSKHDRIAQIILHEQIHMDAVMVDRFGHNYSHRGTDGFGSSGK